MNIFTSIDQVPEHLKLESLAIGNFDGLHIGHQALIKKAIALKGEGKASVLTFSPHPKTFFGHEVPLITPEEEKIRLLAVFGIDVAVLHTVDINFLALSKEHFVKEIIVNKLKVRHVVVGHDFVFGQQALGDVSYLQNCGEIFGFFVHVVSPVHLLDKRSSSSAIRSFLQAGDMASARAMLGRHYSVRGRVILGMQLARKLGFATANILPFTGFCLKHGVYATITRVYEGDAYKDYPSATNVGCRPTVTDDKDVVIESHCLSVDLDLYGKEIEIFFIEYLRPEHKFADLEELKCAIAQDCLKANSLLMHYMGGVGAKGLSRDSSKAS